MTPPDPSTQDPAAEPEATLVELRRALAEGLVRHAETLAGRVEGTGLLRPEALAALLRGIGEVLAGEQQRALETLRPVAHDEDVTPSLRWGAWLWTCWGGIALAELELARTAAEQARRLGETLDSASQSISLCATAEVQAALGDPEGAMESLRTAEQLHEQSGDRQGQAAVLLSQARVLAREARGREAAAAAHAALELAPDWDAPPVFLATLAVREGNPDRAREWLDELDRLGPRPQEGQRLASMLALMDQGTVPHWVVDEYLRLREALPTPEVVEEIEALMLYSPQLYHLREELAWKLIKLGRCDEALPHLRALRDQEVDPAVLASVLLGLSSVASLGEADRAPGARVHAAVASSAPVGPSPGAARGTAGAVPGERERWVQQAVETIAGHSAVFSGDLGTLSLADLLGFLHSGRRTGTVVLQASLGAGAIYLRAGMIVSASSPGCSNIGDLLLERGVINQEQLVEVARRQKEDERNPLMGALFVEAGIVDAPTMQRTLTEQVHAAVRELFPWQEGQFAFLPDSGPATVAPSVEIELDPQHVLLEAARTIDEDSRG